VTDAWGPVFRMSGAVAPDPSPGWRSAPSTLSPEGRGDRLRGSTMITALATLTLRDWGNWEVTPSLSTTSPLRGEVDAQRRVRGTGLSTSLMVGAVAPNLSPGWRVAPSILSPKGRGDLVAGSGVRTR
jgi:hypothetical protein